MLNALFYPTGTPENPIQFESLYIPWIYKEIYFDKVYDDTLNGKKDLVILDVGANLGIVTQFMRDFAKKVYAIEPASEHFEALSKNKEFNNWDNVELFKLAIAGTNGEMKLSKTSSNLTCNSLVNDYQDEGEIVKTQTFNTFFKENNIDEVDFCKFDVEGAEEQILCSPDFNDIAPKIKSIMVEFHYETYPKIVFHLLGLGYTAKRYPSSAIIYLFTR